MSFVRVKAQGGDWRHVPNLLRKIKDRAMGRTTDSLTRDATEFLARKLREGILSGAPGGERFEPNAEATIRRKGHGQVGVWTKTLVDSMKVRKVHKGKYAIGPRIGEPHPKATDTVATILQVADVFELGRPGLQPPRPFIGPVLEEYEDEIFRTFFKGMDAAMDPRRS